MATASGRSSAAALLILALVIAAAAVAADAEGSRKFCPLYCLRASYMLCNSTGAEKRTPVCNCCLAPAGDGCSLYLPGGTVIRCA